MKKLLRRFLKATSWAWFSFVTTLIVAGASIQDMGFAIQYACMMAPLIVYVSLGIVVVYVAHEYVWDVKEKK
jgi:magnesium-transporting ATPase (P-type)